MHYLSLDTVIYRPAGLQDIVLCQYDDVMAGAGERQALHPDPARGCDWQPLDAPGRARQRLPADDPDGGQGLGDVCPRPGMGLDLQETLTLHPEGTVTWLSCYHQRRPSRTRTYHATVDLVQPLPLTSDHDLGPDGPRLGRRPEDIRLPDTEGKAWAAVQLSLTLTGEIS